MRCTEATLRALGVYGECPQFGVGVVSALERAGRVLTMMDGGMTVRRFVERHPRGSYYIAVSGHAMALVDGRLTDTEERGPNGRRVTFAFKVER